MKEASAQLQKSLKKIQEDIPELSGMTPVFGLKKIYRSFWQSKMIKLQEAIIKVVELIDLWEYPPTNLPFESEEFSLAWKDWRMYFYEESGNFLAGIREKKQLEAIAECGTSQEAVKTLNYLINKGYTYIFKVNHDFKNKKKSQTQTNLSDEDYE